MKPSASDDEQPSHCELTWMEIHAQACHIISELTSLTDKLDTSIEEESGILNNLQKMSKNNADDETSQECSVKKCTIFHASDLTFMQMNCMKNWNQLVETWNRDKIPFYSSISKKTSPIRCTALQRIHNRKMEQLRAMVLSRRAVFILQMYDVIMVGLEIMAIIGVEALAASLLQKAIMGIVAFNDLLAVSRNDKEQIKIGFAMPDAISIQKILSIIADQRAANMANILADILLAAMQSGERSNCSSADDEQMFVTPTSDDCHNVNIPVITSDYGSDQHAACSTENRLLANQQTVDGLTALRTLQSQEELNIAKLVSVIHLTLTDAHDGGSGETSQSGQRRLHEWWTIHGYHDHHRTESLSSGKDEATLSSTASNLSMYYQKRLQTQIADMLTCHTRLTDVLLLMPSNMVHVGDCALKLCEAFDDKLPVAKVYRQLQVFLYVEALRKSWDYGMCRSLVAAADSKCLSAVPIDGCGQGTHAGRCLAKTLEPLIRLELATVHDKGLDTAYVHDTVIPRLSASLRLTELWLRTRISAALTSWKPTTFCLIMQNDLKAIIDLLKHCANVHPTQREVAFRPVATWDDANETIIKIQNYFSSFMKQFCAICSERVHAILQQNMPRGKYWRQKYMKQGILKGCSPYVAQLIDEILGPVVTGVSRLSVAAQISILTMALTALCEAWMNHILTHQIRFSLHGARLLKLDIDHVADFLGSHPTLSYEARQSALALAAFQQLRESAGLLLRQNKTSTVIRFRMRRVAPLSQADPEPVGTHRLDRLDSNQSGVQGGDDDIQNKDRWLQLRVNSHEHQSSFWCFT